MSRSNLMYQLQFAVYGVMDYLNSDDLKICQIEIPLSGEEGTTHGAIIGESAVYIAEISFAQVTTEYDERVGVGLCLQCPIRVPDGNKEEVKKLFEQEFLDIDLEWDVNIPGTWGLANCFAFPWDEACVDEDGCVDSGEAFTRLLDFVMNHIQLMEKSFVMANRIFHGGYCADRYGYGYRS